MKSPMQQLKKILVSFLIFGSILTSLPDVFAEQHTSFTEKKFAAFPTQVADSLQLIAEAENIYSALFLEEVGLRPEAFNLAYKGWKKLEEQHLLNRDSILSIVDYSQPSINKRLYVVDMKNGKIFFNTFVSHGRNSGTLMATRFSNRISSNQSSPGFYITGTTYFGSNGYSLKLNGLEKNINDRAMQRAIVMHGADYVSEKSIRLLGYLGRSQGCPAISQEEAREIIDFIKEGSCLFIYTPGNQYLKNSTFLYS